MTWFARGLAILMVSCCALLPSCGWDGQFDILGYTTRPNYDSRIHTVRVPIFKNRTFYRGLEFELTQTVVQQIEAITPFKVVSETGHADTELLGTIVTFNKNILNRNQLNEVREAETVLAVEIVWKDLRTGEIISKPKPTPGGAPPPPPKPGQPPPPPPPVLVTSVGHFIPELGQSLTSAQKENVDRLAVQIVSMMEKPW
ncbi:MAG TPA: LPS assembly lipoprotein LptE [Gemmataceae bacterium]|nr:LPS assembly lipoprotein LptE [Gemmataceae bacterium]